MGVLMPPSPISDKTMSNLAKLLCHAIELKAKIRNALVT